MTEKEIEKGNKRTGKWISSVVVLTIVLSVLAVSVASVSAQVVPPPPGPTSITVTAYPTIINATGIEVSTITATTEVPPGVEKGGHTINFAVIEGDAILSKESDKTNEQGVAYTELSGTTPGDVIVEAWSLKNTSVCDEVTVTLTEPGADTTRPYTSGHNPADGDTNVPIDTNIVVHVKDDGAGVDQTTIVMTVEGATVTPVISGSEADYTLTCDPADFGYVQVVDVTIDASDLAATPNVMQQDAYSFTTQAAPVYDVNLTVDDETKTTTLGVNATYTLTVENTGTVADDYILSVDNVTQADIAGLDIYEITALGAGETADVSLTVGDADIGTYIVNVTVTGTGVSDKVMTTTIVTDLISFTIDFATGYNMISMPVNDTSVTNASTLITKIGAANCTELFKWNTTTPGWESYNPSMPPAAAFNIVGGEGYFVSMNGPETVVFTGICWESPFTISLVTGYNMMGFPVNDISVTNASLLIAEIGAANCTEVFKWNKTSQGWQSYNPSMPPAAAFDTGCGEGYFVSMAGPADVAFEGEPCQD